MYRLAYTCLLYLALPIILLRLWLKSFAMPGYRARLGERFGRISLAPAGGESRIWIHAVSVGETAASEPLVHALLAAYPDCRIHITSMTPTGSARAQQLFADLHNVSHSYLPYDYPAALNRFLNRLQPAMLILMETELWPNLIHATHKRGIKILLANARLSARSARSYGRFPSATASMLRQLAAIAAQGEADAARFRQLGATPARVHVTGSLKFNVQVPPVHIQSHPLYATVHASGNKQRPVVLAASTREGEEPKVLTAFRQVLTAVPDCLLLLVPRHPQRFNAVATLLEKEGFSYLRRSTLDFPEAQEVSTHSSSAPAPQAILGDSMGEMPAYLELAHIAFVGGSLVDTGCQNVLEPAARGLPIVTGPSQYNFAAICQSLEDQGALTTITDANALARALIDLLNNPAKRQQQGDAAKMLIAANQQALPQLMKVVAALLSSAGTAAAGDG